VTSLSIVVPVLGEARNLERLLPELRDLTPEPEVLIVDGGSSDDTEAVVARWPSARLVASARGRAVQMNTGAAQAAGDVLLFLHADTRLPPGFAEAIERVLGDQRVVGGRFDVRFDNPAWPFRMIAALMNLRSRLSGIFTGDQAIFVRRTAFEALGGYAPIPLMEDIELTRRLRRLGRVACLRRRVTTSARKWERDGIARTIGLMWALRFLYVCGVSPARLHRWYYPALAALPEAPAPADRRPRDR